MVSNNANKMGYQLFQLPAILRLYIGKVCPVNITHPLIKIQIQRNKWRFCHVLHAHTCIFAIQFNHSGALGLPLFWNRERKQLIGWPLAFLPNTTIRSHFSFLASTYCFLFLPLHVWFGAFLLFSLLTLLRLQNI